MRTSSTRLRPDSRLQTTLRAAVAGTAAGAAGTTALNAATYLDMALRGRPASSTPEQSIEQLSARTGLSVPGEGQARRNRLSGLGALAGIVAGVGTGTALGLLRGAGWRPRRAVGVAAGTGAAMLAGNGPMIVLRVTNPGQWGLSGWLADLLPHLAYGAVTAATLDALDRGR